MMRILVWLSIAVFITTIYWPQLLNNSGLIYGAIVTVILMCWAKWRFLSVIPLTALYFSVFTYIVLFAGSTELTNNYFTNLNKSIFFQDSKKPTDFISLALNDLDNNITVEVKSLINAKNRGYFVANIISINNSACNYCPLIEMRWYNPQIDVQAGQVHQFKVRIKPLQGKANPNSFDRQKWRYSQHIAYVANIRQHLAIQSDAISLRAKLYLKVLKLTHGLPQQGALIALIFADKSLISEKHKQTIKALGIAHLFAISGLHIGLLFVFSLLFSHLFFKKILPSQLLGWFSFRLIHLVSFSVCLAYAYISGFSLPTQRALLMLVFTIFMLSSKRKINSFDLLVLCFWVILLIDPIATLSSSLWLSFTAMSAILIFIWMIQRKPQVEETNLVYRKVWWRVNLGRFLTFFKWLLLMQLALTLFMLPIQLLSFSAISIFALLINLVAIPLFSWLIIPLTLSGTFLAVVNESLASLLFRLSNYLLDSFLLHADSLSFAYIYLPEIDIKLTLTAFLLALLAVLLFLYKRYVFSKSKKLSVLYCLLITFVIFRLIELEIQTKNSWQVEVFDVGQGLAVLITVNDHYLLYDTGPSYAGNYSVATYSILPYLKARGVEAIDYLIISHSDNDHSGGRYVIEKNIKINKAYAGEAHLVNYSSVVQPLIYKQCLTGQSFHLDKLNIDVISPGKVTKNNNDNSCVVKVSDASNSVLLSGDISRSVELQLVTNQNLGKTATTLQADILIAPHHGSKTSSSSAFINMVNPSWVVFAAGYKNRWRFPVTSVVERYTNLDVKPLTTGNIGFIRFNVQNQVIEVKTYREDLAAYWYHHHLEF